MSETIHTGNKYLRWIHSSRGDAQHRISEATGIEIQIDVYDVETAYDVKCPARQHAIKKLLCAGFRSKGDALQDLIEARDAVTRAIELAKVQYLEAVLPLQPEELNPTRGAVTVPLNGADNG